MKKKIKLTESSKIDYVKISELMVLLSTMLNKGTYFADIYFDGETLYLAPSRIPSKNELDGNNIISKIDFNEED